MIGPENVPSRVAELPRTLAATLAAVLFASLFCPPQVRAQNGPIVITPEEPAATSPVQVLSGIRNVRLWTYSPARTIRKVVMLIDGEERAELPCCAGRGDVREAVPAAPLETGASIAWNWALVENGRHQVVFRVTDSAGRSRGTDPIPVEVRNPQDIATLGRRLDEIDLSGADCSQASGRVCCKNAILKSASQEQVCNNICYEWDRASQGLSLRGANCGGVSAASAIALSETAAKRERPTAGAIVIGQEEPADGQVLAGVRNVRLWTFSRSGEIASVVMLIDGKQVADLPCCAGRGDVFGSVEGAPPDTGASIAWNWALVPNGEHEVVLRVTDTTGEQAEVFANVVVVNPQETSLGAFLAAADYSSADCERNGSMVCCNGVRLKGKGREQVCSNVCYRWDKASQGLIPGGEPSCSAAAIVDVATVSVEAVGEGRGTIESVPEGIACPPTCSAQFALGERVELRARPDSESVFEGWSGCSFKPAGATGIEISAVDGISCTVRFTEARAPAPTPQGTAGPSFSVTPRPSSIATPTRTPTPIRTPTPPPTPRRTPTPPPGPTETPWIYKGVDQSSCRDGNEDPGEECDQGAANLECVRDDAPIPVDCGGAPPSGSGAASCQYCRDSLVGVGQAALECEVGQQLCQFDDGNPIPGTCVTCEVAASPTLCWASRCRRFDGDRGQFGQFPKARAGELEAIVMEVFNLDTGQLVRLVDKVFDPDCDAQIPAATTGAASCASLYKVKSIRPIGGTKPGPLCTFDNLDDVNTIARTPQSVGVVLVDVNGQLCEARALPGDDWVTYYQTCCAPAAVFGVAGERIQTTTTLVIDQGAGGCRMDVVGRPAVDTFPFTVAEPCL